jgi:hypothetical protein
MESGRATDSCTFQPPEVSIDGGATKLSGRSGLTIWSGDPE